jgi:hypothetical protein
MADLIWSVLGMGTVVGIFFLPIFFIGYHSTRRMWKDNIEKAEKSDKFNLFFFTYQWAARGEYWKLYSFYIIGCLALGWLVGYSYYLSNL